MQLTDATTIVRPSMDDDTGTTQENTYTYLIKAAITVTGSNPLLVCIYQSYKNYGISYTITLLMLLRWPSGGSKAVMMVNQGATIDIPYDFGQKLNL